MDKSRIEKIRILAALHDGIVTIDDLRQNKIYRFQEIAPGVFEFEGKTYSQEEMELVTEQAQKGYEKSMMLLDKPIEDRIIGFTFLLPPDIPEPVKPVIVEEPALPPSSTVEPPSTTKGYLDQLYDEAEITNQEEPGEAIKPEIISSGEEQESPEKKEEIILLRNITHKFLH